MKTLVVLIGMMGCGKTTVGKILAEMLGYTFIDLDKEIENREKKNISKIFNDFGEQYFREIEKEMIREFSVLSKTVVSLGGGAFQDVETQKILKTNSVIIYLKATSGTIYNRIKNEIHRPLLCKNFSIETIDFILKKRKSNYEKAHHKIITDNKTPEQIAKEILGVLK